MNELIRTSRALSKAVGRLRFRDPITHVYNPLEYARASHERYLASYGDKTKEVLLLGMNPGPFGMAQTGIPFGDVSSVREWLGIEEPVGKPTNEHPKRPVDGFGCPRSEVSGSRLWGWAKERFGAPEQFFSRFFIANYCPLVFLEASGKNRTPDKLPASERTELETACDQALRHTVQHLQPQHVIGIGAWAERRAQFALRGENVHIARVLHPSPASPKANRGWAEQAEQDFIRAGIELDVTSP